MPRPDPRGGDGSDADDQIADLQYRDACELAVGHGVSTCASPGPYGICREVRTTWLPSAEVEKVEPVVGIWVRRFDGADVPDEEGDES